MEVQFHTAPIKLEFSASVGFILKVSVTMHGHTIFKKKPRRGKVFEKVTMKRVPPRHKKLRNSLPSPLRCGTEPPG